MVEHQGVYLLQYFLKEKRKLTKPLGNQYNFVPDKPWLMRMFISEYKYNETDRQTRRQTRK